METEKTLKPLPEGYTRRKMESTPNEKPLPEGYTRRKMEPEPEGEYEPKTEFQGDYGTVWEIAKGVTSGATLGVSERLGLKPGTSGKSKFAHSVGEAVGSILPLTPALKYMSKGAQFLAGKSPVFKKSAEALLDIIGGGVVGGLHHGVTETAKGNEVTPDDILTHGGYWVALDVGLRSAAFGYGFAKNFGKGLYELARNLKVPEKQLLTEAAEIIQANNIDTPTNEQIVEAFDKIVKQSTEAGVTPKELYSRPGLGKQKLLTELSTPAPNQNLLTKQYDFNVPKSEPLGDLPQYSPNTNIAVPGGKPLGEPKAAQTTELASTNLSTPAANKKPDITQATELGTPELSPYRQPTVKSELTPEQRRSIQQQNFLALAKAQHEVQPQSIQVAEEAIHQPTITPKDLKERYIEPQDTPITEMIKDTSSIAEPRQPHGADFFEESEASAKTFIDQRIAKTGEPAKSRRELGGRVKADVNKNISEGKAEYKPLYDEAEDAAAGILTDAENTGRVGGEIIIKVEPPATRPSEYSKTINDTENALKDAGFKVEKDKETGAIKVYSEKNVPVSNLIELGRRLGEIINFETIVPSVKKILKKLKAAVKDDIRVGLRDHPDTLTAFDLAEEAHAKLAKKYDTPTVWKVRETHEGEKIADLLEQPTVFHEVQDLLTPEQMAVVERELLDKLNKSSYEKGQEILREFGNSLSAEKNQLAKDIVASKHPNKPDTRRASVMGAILDDLSMAFTTGQRPELALKLWQTTKGQWLVKEAMQGSPNRKATVDYLSKQSFSDMVASVLDKGTAKISPKKLGQFMEQAGVISNIRMQGGDQAAEFFLNLEGKLLRFQQNAKLLDTIPNKTDLKKGIDLLHKTKVKNKDKLEHALKEQLESQKTGKKKFEQLKEIGKENERKAPRGEERISKASEARLQKKKTEQKALEERKAKEAAEDKQRFENLKAIGLENKRTSELGLSRIKRVKEKNKFRQAQVEAARRSIPRRLMDVTKEFLGFSPKAMLSVFSLMKFSIPNAAGAIFAYNAFEYMLKSPTFRKAFNEACKQGIDPVAFLIFVQIASDELDNE